MRRRANGFSSRPSKLAPLNPFSRGRVNQSTGARFEQYVAFMAQREGLMLVKNGLRAKRYADKVVCERSNVDFLLLGDAAAREVAFLDAKSFAGARFGRSMIDARQLHLCLQYASRGFAAGFLVLLREPDHVGFYSAEILSAGKSRQGFGVADGVRLGTLRAFSLAGIWQLRSAP